MKQITIGWIFLSSLVGVVGYLSSNNILIGALLFLIFLIYYLLIARKVLKNYIEKVDRIHTCYHFINSFLVTLSVKESLEDAYESATRIDNKYLSEEVQNLKKLNVYDRIIYLRSFFNLAIYKMFINVLDLYQDQGGNILSMSDNLLRECTRTEKVLNEVIQIGNKHIIEFILLWVMSFGIVLFMRFGIQDFYLLMLQKNMFVTMIFCFYLICLGSIHLFVYKYTDLKIKEDKE